MQDLSTRLESQLEALGYELVALERAGRGLLRLFIDKPEGIGIEDCVTVSHQLTHWMTVENIDYDRLEVSSPGLDRLLSKPRDFERFAGEAVTLKLRIPLNNRRKLVGQLVGLDAGQIKLLVDGAAIAVDTSNVESTRLKPEL